MADLDERLNRLVADQDSMKKVVETAKAILAQRNGPDPGSAETSDTSPTPKEPPSAGSPETGSAASLTALLQQLTEQKGPEPANSGTASGTPPSAQGAAIPALAAALPQFMTALSGQGNLLKSERVDLLNAMRPYLKEERAGSIDRALKMANVAKAAMSAMHLLGR